MTEDSRDQGKAGRGTSELTGERSRVQEDVVSFIIPAKNEAETIGRSIKSIRSTAKGLFNTEIIVVDHGSSDETVAVARREADRVHVERKGTVGHLRNIGAMSSKGNVLVFLDADVWLKDNWGTIAGAIIRRLRNQGRTIIGSYCQVPDDARWIERYWFSGRVNRGAHVGSGHMITSRSFFDELQGFDVSMETGEDYDLCARAKNLGGEVIVVPELGAVHEGFPRSARSFIAREAWHGRGDFERFGALVRSRVAWATLGFMGLHGALIGFAAAGYPTLSILSGVALIAMCVLIALRNQGIQSARRIPVTSLIAYLYLLGRSAALLRTTSHWMTARRDRAESK